MRYLQNLFTRIFTSVNFYSNLTFILFAWFLYTALFDRVAYDETNILRLLLPLIQVTAILISTGFAVGIYAVERSKVKQKMPSIIDILPYPRQIQDTIEFNWVCEDETL